MSTTFDHLGFHPDTPPGPTKFNFLPRCAVQAGLCIVLFEAGSLILKERTALTVSK